MRDDSAALDGRRFDRTMSRSCARNRMPPPLKSKKSKFVCSWIFAAMVVACASPAAKLSRMYDDVHKDAAEQSHSTREPSELRARRDSRAAKAREIVDAGGAQSATDYLHAAVILVETDSDENLALALELALKSAELGEDKGFRVAAEATDKHLVKLGMHQRYGTQYTYEHVLKAWRLYPCDPRTTDAERQAMGVPPMAKLLEAEATLNAPTSKRSDPVFLTRPSGS